ncbi:MULTISPECIES: MerR family transcriptional regulator [Kordiimonas]|uniref:MerR family transcriptional regulator n=1 Tax=Kordiimonas TaxID=288021 RepID=UPI00257FD8F9|nr:MerR family transcriptional regulator [Kordiimonas sp. UBA4487]
MSTLVKIGEAAKNIGLPEKTIRYYEDIGLVNPLRAENGFRQYRQSDLQLLRIVKGARELGFSIDDSRALLDLFNNDARSSAEVKALATKQLQETRKKIDRLKNLEAKLQHLTNRCQGNHKPDCAILDFLADPH